MSPPPDPADDVDPRPAPTDAPPIDVGDAARPSVAAPTQAGAPWMVGGGAMLLGVVVFAWLASHRPHPPADLTSAQETPGAAAPASGPMPIPPEIAQEEAAGRGTGYPLTQTPTFVIPTPPATAAPPLAVAAGPVARPGPSDADALQRRKAPALVVDLADPNAPASGAAGNTTGPAQPVGKTTLNTDEQFAQRVGADAPERASASQLHDLPSTIAQGVMIPGVLETALNSDLPGFTRAVVSRDVRSFDSSTVLIPRGSRVIGQYRSAAALGASRAFVIWTRIIRPDGVSIQIGSSGTDPLGRAGLEGSVDRHFFQRFGGAILLSVVNAGVTGALSHSNSSTVYVGSSQEATGLGDVAQVTHIPPTIKVPQGTPIRIFVARDLDFSTVERVAAP
jgi:type IV secretory pathway VirB10-like protein